MKKPATALLTMREITEYTGRNRATIKRWIREDNFPAVKIDGRWESNTDLIDEFRHRRIERAVNGGG
jgi:predicted transcriptional regulator